jgi:hypothetical protein
MSRNEMDETQRAAIFELRGRTPPVPYAKIAEQLGIPESQVYREHKRPAPAGRNGGEAMPAFTRRAPADDEDPEVTAAAKRVELKKLELQEHEITRRLALLDGKALGQDSAMASVVALLSEQMRRMEENFDRRLALSQPTKAPEDPTQSVVRAIGTLTTLQQQVAQLVPPPPVPATISPEHVELRVLMEKLNLESEAVRQKAAADAARWNKVWGIAEQNAPIILGAFQKWLDNQSKQTQGAPARPTLQVLEGGRTEVVSPGPAAEVPMTCTSCQSKFMVRPEPGELPACTVCGGVLREDGTPEPPKPAWPEDAVFS